MFSIPYAKPINQTSNQLWIEIKLTRLNIAVTLACFDHVVVDMVDGEISPAPIHQFRLLQGFFLPWVTEKYPAWLTWFHPQEVLDTWLWQRHLLP